MFHYLNVFWGPRLLLILYNYTFICLFMHVNLLSDNLSKQFLFGMYFNYILNPFRKSATKLFFRLVHHCTHSTVQPPFFHCIIEEWYWKWDCTVCCICVHVLILVSDKKKVYFLDKKVSLFWHGERLKKKIFFERETAWLQDLIKKIFL